MTPVTSVGPVGPRMTSRSSVPAASGPGVSCSARSIGRLPLREALDVGEVVEHGVGRARDDDLAIDLDHRNAPA